MTKHESQRKKVRHRRIRKPKTTLWKKANVRPHLLKSAAVPTNRGQRYAKSSCQKPINKCNNNWQIKWKLGARMNAELDWFKLQRTTKYISKSYPQFLHPASSSGRSAGKIGISLSSKSQFVPTRKHTNLGCGSLQAKRSVYSRKN